MTEDAMCAVFADVLGVSEVDATDSFFDLGGHSLLAAKLVRQIKTQFGAPVTLRRVYETPTARALVGALAAA